MPPSSNTDEQPFHMNDPIDLRVMSRSDLPFADALREVVGWNQTRRDWETFLALSPDGCFVAEWHGQPAGTAITVRFGDKLAWIGMLLVHPDYRRQGIGKALLTWCLGNLHEHGVPCIKLDATPQGKRLYDHLGFVTQWSITRWKTPCLSDPGAVTSLEIRHIEEDDWAAVAASDEQTFGVNRAPLLGKLCHTASCLLLHQSHGVITGYGMLRDGVRAKYLGPVAAQSPAAGIGLVKGLLSSARDQPVYWDIPDANLAAVTLAGQLGFTPQRSLIRMTHGAESNPGRPDHYFAIADPAVG
jgi:ribosomal protein S18 acetylase RimI-like enzyme